MKFGATCSTSFAARDDGREAFLAAFAGTFFALALVDVFAAFFEPRLVRFAVMT